MNSTSAKYINSFLLNTEIHCIKVCFDVQSDEMMAGESCDKERQHVSRSHRPHGNDVSLLNGKYLSACFMHLNRSHLISVIDLVQETPLFFFTFHTVCFSSFKIYWFLSEHRLPGKNLSFVI